MEALASPTLAACGHHLPRPTQQQAASEQQAGGLLPVIPQADSGQPVGGLHASQAGCTGSCSEAAGGSRAAAAGEEGSAVDSAEALAARLEEEDDSAG